jgi:hypothetical protein
MYFSFNFTDRVKYQARQMPKVESFSNSPSKTRDMTSELALIRGQAGEHREKGGLEGQQVSQLPETSVADT